MTPNLTLVVILGALFAAGVYLVLERSLTRVLLGVLLLSNAVNLLLIVAGGSAGGAPIVGVTPIPEMSDPVPQVMVLTAIVITLGVASFVLAIIYRGWVLDSEDDVVIDAADREIAARAAANDRQDDS